MSIIQVDGRQVEIADGQNLLAGLTEAGIDVPYFCWHPTLGSIGACRQCAVKQFADENDTRGRLIMSCMTPAAGVKKLSVNDPEAVEFRAELIESLMANHPHDCPVCDAGGQCHLQDMTVMSGHNYRKHRFPKRTFKSQDLGPLIHHEMNRCITCYRCVRYYKDYAGGRDFDAYASKNHVYFGRPTDGTLQSEFAGNLVEVCPTGVFTDKTARRHYARKWDLQMAPSLCTHCSVGCSIIPGERYGTVRQVQNRYHNEVNGYFLCDRGRFGYEFTSSDTRLRRAQLDGQPIEADEAAARFADLLARAKGVIGVGSPRASVESNQALRHLVGPTRFFAGVAARQDAAVRRALALLQGSARVASVQEIEAADAALVLGEDVSNTAPRIALALRQVAFAAPKAAAKKLGIADWHAYALKYATQLAGAGPLFVATLAATRLDRDARFALRMSPEQTAAFGFAVAAAIGGAEASPEARAVAEALLGAQRPVVVSGVHAGDPAVMDAAAAVAQALVAAGRGAGLSLVLPEANSAGLALLSESGLDSVFDAVEAGEADTVVVLENDLLRRASAARVQALARRATLIVLDSLASDTVKLAKLALPADAVTEDTGTFVSQEGRAQRYFEVHAPLSDAAPSWRWLCRAARDLGRWDHPADLDYEELLDAASEAHPLLAPIGEVAPGSEWRAWGLKLARQPHRFSGRTALLGLDSMHEPRPTQDPVAPYNFSMEGLQGRALQKYGAQVPYFWSPSWNSNQAVLRFQSRLGGPLRGGTLGRRLFQPGEPVRTEAAATPRAGLTAYEGIRVFGSEELSNHAPGILARAEPPALRVGAAVAAAHGLVDGGSAHLRLADVGLHLPVRVEADLAPDAVLVPVGAPGLPWLDLPAAAAFTSHGAS